jgi:ABC-type dipeptide/oligopeptide/nickel transport system permease component
MVESRLEQSVGRHVSRARNMSYIWRFLRKRALFLIPQVLGVLIITFFLTRLVPGDPARLIAGNLAPEKGVELLREKMGLKGPMYMQLAIYLRNLFQGDWGVSWFTANSVLKDIQVRLPATLEIIIPSLLLTFFVLLPLALRSTSTSKGFMQNVSKRVMFSYGMAAGAFPDFWLALIAVWIFYATLHWLPAPLGRLDIGVEPPGYITGLYVVDSLLRGNWRALQSCIKHMVLPVLVLSFVYGGGILKVAMIAATEARKSAYINYAKVCSLSEPLIKRYVNLSVYPPVATMTAIIFGFLIGGAVLVEKVFSWAGLGMYAVQSVVNSDYFAVQGVVLVSAIMNLLIYLIVDFVYIAVDPRIRNIG